MKKSELGNQHVLGEMHIEDMEVRHVLEKQFVHPMHDSTTPDVLNKRIFECLNIAPLTITDFHNGAPGQRIYLLGDGFTTIQNSPHIFTSTVANKLLEVDKVYTFTFFKVGNSSHKWIEDVDDSGGSGSGVAAAHINWTAGYITISATSYTVVAAGMDLVLPAVAGDIISVSLAGIMNSGSGQLMLDVVTLVGGVHTNFISGSTASGNGIQGIRGLPVSATKTFGATIYYTVQAGDIVGGNITLRIVGKLSSSTRQIAATSDEPFSFGAVNYGQ